MPKIKNNIDLSELPRRTQVKAYALHLQRKGSQIVYAKKLGHNRWEVVLTKHDGYTGKRQAELLGMLRRGYSAVRFEG